MPKQIMRDVEWLEIKGKFNFKALTDKARAAMGAEIGGPWQMAADVFFYGVAPDKFDSTIKRLQLMGLNTDEEPKEQIDVTQFTAF